MGYFRGLDLKDALGGQQNMGKFSRMIVPKSIKRVGKTSKKKKIGS